MKKSNKKKTLSSSKNQQTIDTFFSNKNEDPLKCEKKSSEPLKTQLNEIETSLKCNFNKYNFERDSDTKLVVIGGDDSDTDFQSTFKTETFNTIAHCMKNSLYKTKNIQNEDSGTKKLEIDKTDINSVIYKNFQDGECISVINNVSNEKFPIMNTKQILNPKNNLTPLNCKLNSEKNTNRERELLSSNFSGNNVNINANKIQKSKLSTSKRNREIENSDTLVCSSSPDLILLTPPLKKRNKNFTVFKQCNKILKTRNKESQNITQYSKSDEIHCSSFKEKNKRKQSFSPSSIQDKSLILSAINRSKSENEIVHLKSKVNNLSELTSDQLLQTYKQLKDNFNSNKNCINYEVLGKENYTSDEPLLETCKLSIEKNIYLPVNQNVNKLYSPKKIENSSLITSECCTNGLKSTNESEVTDIKNDSEINCEFNISDFENVSIDEWNFKPLEHNMDDIETLDLSVWQNCKIVGIENDYHNNCIILKVQSVKTDEKATCLLKDFWNQSRLNKLDVINIKASQQGTHYVIDNKAGLLVTNPDILISATTVVGSLYCKRKTVLENFYRSIAGGNEIMTIGCIIHEILQIVLRKKIYTVREIKKVFIELIKSSNVINQLYECSLTTKETLKKIYEFLPRIEDFIENYILNKKTNQNKNNWLGSINEVVDIEENIWCPQLGIKGKIDVTIKSDGRLMPVELKTGKASMSAEHRGQLIFYLLMMTQLGQNVHSGLLLYLREGIMREITMEKNDKSGLMMLRNDLAYYISREPVVVGGVNDKISDDGNFEVLKIPEVLSPVLPDPINNSTCANCSYLTLCSVFLSRDNNAKLNSNNPLNLLSKNAISHLTKEHIDYFVNWANLLFIEGSNNKNTKNYSDIWVIPPLEREERGRSLVFVKIKGSVMEYDGKYSTVFVRSEDSHLKINDFRKAGINVSDFVVVSTNERPALAVGNISNITKFTIKINLDRDLTNRYLNQIFHIDTYESSSLLSFNLSSLGHLMENNEKTNSLRKIIIDKAPPIFLSLIPKKVKEIGIKLLRKLNQMQQRAILRAISATDYALIRGMPGTGKTQTVVALIEMLVGLGQSVVVTSHTNSAVDNVLLKLQESGINHCEFVRFGHEGRIHPSIRHRSISLLTSKYQSVEELEKFYNQINVIGVTCFGATHAVFSKRKFDVCIMDESTQVLQPSALRVLFATNKFILIGDPDQLPPLIKSPTANRLGINESLFDRLHSQTATTNLTLQYRMNKMIMTLANNLTYNGLLLSGSDDVRDATLNVPFPDEIADQYRSELWLQRACSSTMKNAVLLLDTDNTYDICEKFYKDHLGILETTESDFETKFCSNICEASIVYSLVSAFLKGGVSAKNIGVITPYCSQVSLLQNLIGEGSVFAEKLLDVIEINTVDQYQGRDKEIIIYSCVQSFQNISESRCIRSDAIQEDKRRLTVAITRAKHKLIIIGDKNSMNKYKPFKELFSHLQSQQIMSLNKSYTGFNWEIVLKRIDSLVKKLNS